MSTLEIWAKGSVSIPMECVGVCCDTRQLIRRLNQLELGLPGWLLLSLAVQDSKVGCEYYPGIYRLETEVGVGCQNLLEICLWWLQSQQTRLYYFSHSRETVTFLASKSAEIHDV